jgi:hypothetical protein
LNFIMRSGVEKRVMQIDSYINDCRLDDIDSRRGH